MLAAAMAKVVGEGIDPLDNEVQQDVEARICLQEAVLVAALSLMLLGRRFSKLHVMLCEYRLWLHCGCWAFFIHTGD